MDNLLIVDDERILCDGIRDTLAPLGFFNLFAAYSGKEALKCAEANRIDALILDIAMPEMNGIEFLRSLGEFCPEMPLTVIVSGYDKFDYAKEAMSYGATDYILKPISPAEVRALGHRLHEALAARREERERMAKLRAFVWENRNVIKQKLLYDIIYERSISVSLDDMKQICGVDLSGRYFLVCLIQIKADDGVRELDFQAALKLAEDALDEIAANCPGINMFGMENARYALIFCAHRPFEPSFVLGVLDEVAASLRRIGGIQFCIGKGNEVGGLRNIQNSYRDADDALAYRAMSGADSIRDADGCRERHKKLAAQVRRVVEERYAEPDLSVYKISELLKYSPNYMGNIFKREYGTTIGDCLTGIRIAAAARLLGETDLKIYDIASRVGFNDSHYFSKSFKKHQGFTPRQYRIRFLKSQTKP